MTDAEHILCEVLPKILDGKNCKPHEVKVKPTTTDGANYTTSLFLVNASSPDRNELKLFAKVACLGDTLRASLNATWMFETEIYVYNHLVKIYDYIQSDRNVFDEYRYVFPKFYGFYPEVGKETVVMENLSEAGFKMYDRFESVDWDHARTAVENLARFHALSFALEKYYPEEYMRYTSKMKFRLVRIGEDKLSESTTTMWKKMMDNVIDLICEEHRDQVRTFLLNNRLVDKFNKPLGKPVIAHGDYRMSNILFRRQIMTMNPDCRTTVLPSVVSQDRNMADAEKTLRDLLDKILDDRDYRPREIEVKAIATTGANYTSALFTVDVSSPKKDDLNLFAKVACIGQTMRARMHADWLYKTERLVYMKLVKIFADIQEENHISGEHRYVFPEFFGCNEELGKETVVMENLIANGFKSYDRFKSIDWNSASVAVDNLAKFHALSFAFNKYKPEEFENMTADMIYAIGEPDDAQDENMIALWMKMVENAAGVVKEEHKERVRDFAMKNTLWSKFYKPIGRPVISHGDYRMSNLLFKTQGDSLQSIAVDYQTVHAGCPASDLIYFIFTGSDEEFRRQHYEKLLDHYYASLEQALERLAVDPGVYTREKFDSDMKEMLPYAVLLGVVVLPVVTVQADAAPSVQGDADVSGFVMAPNELYAQRFRGIVNDCVRWGAI